MFSFGIFLDHSVFMRSLDTMIRKRKNEYFISSRLLIYTNPHFYAIGINQIIKVLVWGHLHPGECRKNQVIKMSNHCQMSIMELIMHMRFLLRFLLPKLRILYSCGDIIGLSAYKIGATRFPRGWRNAWSLGRVSGKGCSGVLNNSRASASRSVEIPNVKVIPCRRVRLQT